eukprot:Colp12_sorted_trinity150504_noHs@24914
MHYKEVSFRRSCSLGLGETNTGIAVVEGGVVRAHEDITKNVEGAVGRGDIQANEARDALADTAGLNLEDILLRGEGELLAGKHEVDVGEGGQLVAVEDSLTLGAGEEVAELLKLALNVLHSTGRLKLLIEQLHSELAQRAGSTVHASSAELNTLADGLGNDLVHETADKLGSVLLDEGVALSSEDANSANLLVDGLSNGRWSGNERGTGISNGVALAVAETHRLASDLNVIHVKLPVSLVGDGEPGELALVVFRVGTAEHKLTTSSASALTVKPEREDRLINEFLLNHVVENRLGTIDRNGGEGETENTVELAGNESNSRLLGSFGKFLTFDLDAGDSHSVRAHEALHRTTAILNGEGSAVSNVGRGLRAVVLLVQVTRNLSKLALGRGDPEVAAASIEHNLEWLWGGTNGNLAVVLSILVIVDGDRSRARLEVLNKGGTRNLHVSKLMLGSLALLERDCDKSSGHAAQE